jgi:hypothetical protein
MRDEADMRRSEGRAGGREAARRALPIAGVVGASALVATTTLLPAPGAAPAATLCVLCGSYGTIDFLLNVALFVPLGAALRMAGLGLGRVLVAGALGTLCIETLQLAAIPGRHASLGDLLANTAGIALGATLVEWWPTLTGPAPATAWRLTGAGSLLCCLALAVTTWALQPVHSTSRVFGQLRPSLAHYDTFAGQQRDARVNGVTIAPGPMPIERAARLALTRAPIHVDVVARGGAPTRRPAPIAGIVTGERVVVARLDQVGTSARLVAGTRAARLGLRSPAVRVRGALADTGREVTLRGVREPALLRLEASPVAGATREVRLRLTPGSGWLLLSPTDGAVGAEGGWLAAAWLALMFAPLAWWAGHTRAPGTGRVPAAIALPVGAALAGLGVVPLVIGGAVSPWYEWVAAAGALLVATLPARRPRDRLSRAHRPDC